MTTKPDVVRPQSKTLTYIFGAMAGGLAVATVLDAGIGHMLSAGGDMLVSGAFAIAAKGYKNGVLSHNLALAQASAFTVGFGLMAASNLNVGRPEWAVINGVIAAVSLYDAVKLVRQPA